MRIVSDTTGSVLDSYAQHDGRILVVDADEGIADTLAAILRQEGYQVAVAYTLRAALDQLREGHVDLVLADVRIEESGDDVLRRTREYAPSAVVVVLTSFASFETALHALQSGAYNYLVKPVDVAELRVTVDRAMQHKQMERTLEAQVRELETAHLQVQSFNAQLQMQVEDATHELREKVQALKEANIQLQRTQEEHERFVAMVAHEMRGPLNPIINYAQLAKRPGITQEAIEHYTDIIVEHAYRLNRLVDDLQTATRLSTGQFTLRREQCDVAAAVSELVDNFTATVRERRFSLERPAEPICAEVDRDRVMQAVRNLVDNAVKYSAEQGAVEVSVWQDAERVSISVRDYGAGIPEEEMQRIFEAFTRLNKDADVSGSGLGLYITRGIVAAHGGELTVQNASGSDRVRGAIFTIALPLHAAQEDATEPAQDGSDS
ncbi:MAG: ATP-binding protein [Ktedonobacterales bacterium]